MSARYTGYKLDKSVLSLSCNVGKLVTSTSFPTESKHKVMLWYTRKYQIDTRQVSRFDHVWSDTQSDLKFWSLYFRTVLSLFYKIMDTVMVLSEVGSTVWWDGKDITAEQMLIYVNIFKMTVSIAYDVLEAKFVFSSNGIIRLLIFFAFWLSAGTNISLQSFPFHSLLPYCGRWFCPRYWKYFIVCDPYIHIY